MSNPAQRQYRTSAKPPRRAANPGGKPAFHLTSVAELISSRICAGPAFTPASPPSLADLVGLPEDHPQGLQPHRLPLLHASGTTPERVLCYFRSKRLPRRCRSNAWDRQTHGTHRCCTRYRFLARSSNSAERAIESESNPGEGSRSPTAYTQHKKPQPRRRQGIIRTAGHRGRYIGKPARPVCQRFLEQSRIRLEKCVGIRQRSQGGLSCRSKRFLQYVCGRPRSAFCNRPISPQRIGC